MAIKYEDIEKANQQVNPTEIKGKMYMEVHQRIKAFRMVFPEGTVSTEIISIENGVCVIRATVGFDDENGNFHILGTGTAYEKEGSTFINKTSYIENCETSAVGRALGMAGFGIDASIASAEEVANAIANQTEDKQEKQERKATPNQISFLLTKYSGENLKKLLKANNIETIDDMPMTKASELIGKIKKGEKA